MRPSDRYVKIIEWSEEDQCHVGSAPELVSGGCHGRDERRVFDELCAIVDEAIELYAAEGKPLPPPTSGRRRGYLPSVAWPNRHRPCTVFGRLRVSDHMLAWRVINNQPAHAPGHPQLSVAQTWHDSAVETRLPHYRREETRHMAKTLHPVAMKADTDCLIAFLGSDTAPATMPFIVLEGYLTGILLAPETIMPSRWLNVIWGDEPPPFENLEHAQKIVGAIMGHYNGLNVRLNPDLGGDPAKFELPFASDDTKLASLWAGGFLTALEVAPHAWTPLEEAMGQKGDGVPLAVLLSPMIMLGGPRDKSNPLWSRSATKLRANELDAITHIPMVIQGLSLFRRALKAGTKPGTLVQDTTRIARPAPRAAAQGRRRAAR